MSHLTTSAAWRALEKHYAAIHHKHMRDLFSSDPTRAEQFQLEAAGLSLDYSKNLITAETIELLLKLAEQANVGAWRDRMFNGETINHTERRSVLHIALRNRSQRPVLLNDQDVMSEIHAVQSKMNAFVAAVLEGQWLGYRGDAITDVINIGIGGSDLGPYMVSQALTPYKNPNLRVHFVSNVDGAHMQDALQSCRPETTLFIVSSKSFSTQETLNNALAARAWFVQGGGSDSDINKHFVAVTSNNKLATEFGIAPEAQFAMWDWVGGRFSLWSAIGLPIALSVGMDNFEKLLEGAHAMDEHFRTAALRQNMPVLMALLGVWYNNFFGYESYAILPYIQHLESLPSYLQQADMESNGKSVNRDGELVDYQTGPIIWGGTGTNAQHAFFQLMHQGTKVIPADFILSKNSHASLTEQHSMLLANGIAQMEALMRGKSKSEVEAELAKKRLSTAEQSHLTPYMEFAGNKPSNAIVMDKLTPQALGALIALYEHKIFVQGIVWNLNSFDQWGVEYGKQLAQGVLKSFKNEQDSGFEVSSSTSRLMERLKSVS